MTKMGSIDSHRIDYNGVEVLRSQRHITQEKLTEVLPPGVPCKRAQHCWPTTRNIVVPNILRPSAWNHNNVGTCCV